MSTQTPDQDQDPSDQAKPDELEETMNASVDENNAEQDPLEQAAAKLAECEETTQRAKDDLLRVQAEMQNVRRRAEQDVEKAHKYGQEKFSIELLAVVDNLERSLEVASNNEDETVKAIYEGVNLTLKSFLDCFTKFNIEAVDPLGEPFDPQLHQAMSIQENAECEPNTVIAVIQKGYTLHGRVIRPAMVMVSK
ncbi:MAG: nucleotide exchange factor GrpE [Gammaproteobacteria bacterium]|jgi:molecular chaperone GrpE|nr:nucleotide exchange factor GrpE [Gammaproteobacteria bacterium]MDG2338493.1 nucleotide exchange factor GrpE [Gammaproteobacteria bacterium]